MKEKIIEIREISLAIFFTNIVVIAILYRIIFAETLNRDDKGILGFLGILLFSAIAIALSSIIGFLIYGGYNAFLKWTRKEEQKIETNISEFNIISTGVMAAIILWMLLQTSGVFQ